MAEAFISQRGGLGSLTINGQEIMEVVFGETINRGDRVVIQTIYNGGEYRAYLYIDGSTYANCFLGYAVESGLSNESRKVAKLFRI